MCLRHLTEGYHHQYIPSIYSCKLGVRHPTNSSDDGAFRPLERVKKPPARSVQKAGNHCNQCRLPKNGAARSAPTGCLSRHSSQVSCARGELSTAAQLPHPTDLPAKEDPNLAFGAAVPAAELGEVQQR